MNDFKHFFSPRMGCVENIHFVGIGGAGMCGIAEVLHNEGYRISGSDLSENNAVERLKTLGIKIYNQHHIDNIVNAHVIVSSTAINADNPEILAARARSIPVIPRAAMLAELMRFRYGIAIAGTHGKTTTTSLVSSLLGQGGLDPSFVIGGKLNSCGSNAQLGKSAYFVVEADESDASFLYLKPMIAVVTNIDADHLSTYDNNFDKLTETFLEFIHHLPFYGTAVVCSDDDNVRKLLPSIARPLLTYGFNDQAQYKAINWQQQGLMSEFTVVRPGSLAPLQVQSRIPGRHNVLNALAAIAVASVVGVEDGAIIEGLKNFQGVGRRFQMLGEQSFTQGKALIVDDYGHHPQEMTATIAAMRAVWPDKRLIHVFQPHRYTRTQSLMEQFELALGLADEVLLMDIYPAGESPIPGITSQQLMTRIQQQGHKIRLVDELTLLSALDEVVLTNSVVLLQGAGSIGQLAVKLSQMERDPA